MSHPVVPAGPFSSAIARVVALCCRWPARVVLLGMILALGAGTYTAARFSLTSETEYLISHRLPWRQREDTFNRLFQPEGDQIVAVIDGATPERAEQAAAALTQTLAARPDLFRFVRRPDGGPFFARNGLLFQSTAEVRNQLAELIAAQPFLGPLAADPSLRGLALTLSTALQGVNSDQAKLADLDRPIAALGDTLSRLRAGEPAFFSWRTLISGERPTTRELRRIVLASPVLDYARLQSGAEPSDYIRGAARRLSLDPAHGVRIRLTGPAPLQDEEFATLAEGAGLIAVLAVSAIVAMLWFAVRSVRLIGAILLTTVVGLILAATAGLMIFHRFNVISVAFIPLFVGLGIDFGIQFSVRFRAEQSAGAPTTKALVDAAAGMGGSLALAASAIALGFLAFAPTAYVGVSQLGVIAGVGMLIALVLNLSLLPALIRLLDPPRAGAEGAVASLERLDGFILGHRRQVLGTAAGAALLCAALLPLLRFDFNPLHLKSVKVESVSTLLDLMKDPDQSPDTLELIAPSLKAADARAQAVGRLPEVSQARTLSSFVPADQDEKLAAIGDAAMLLDLTLDPIVTAPPPSDAETIAALGQTAVDLRTAATTATPARADRARRLADNLDWLAHASPLARARASEVLIPGLETILSQTREALQAQPVTVQSLPAEITRDWLTPDGRARISLVPKGDSNKDSVLGPFIAAVAREAPDLTGAPYDTQQGGKAVQEAFLQAGLLSFVAITLLLFAALRRVRDVAITMAPIVLTGLLTLGSCVLIGQPLNFANIIALPLLFGIGVAFHIYFVLAWRAGGSHLLQSSLTRAVFFSALATATGFGSLWASSHPGTASMGKLLMISLVWTLVSALLFQPALMGPPRPAAP